MEAVDGYASACDHSPLLRVLPWNAGRPGRGRGSVQGEAMFVLRPVEA